MTTASTQASSVVLRVESLRLPFAIMYANGQVMEAQVICVVNVGENKVISFCTTQLSESEVGVRQALYEAIVAGRRPSSESRDGLEWALPSQIQVLTSEEHAVLLSPLCAELSIGLETHVNKGPNTRTPIVQEIDRRWANAGVQYQNRILPVSRFEMQFDNLLVHVQGHGPKRHEKEQNRMYGALRGYGRDPGESLASLRQLMLMTPGVIEDGTIVQGGVRYTDELLRLWPGRRVQLRQSFESKATTWVYFEQNVVCIARAAELRRKDGSYRSGR